MTDPIIIKYILTLLNFLIFTLRTARTLTILDVGCFELTDCRVVYACFYFITCEIMLDMKYPMTQSRPTLSRDAHVMLNNVGFVYVSMFADLSHLQLINSLSTIATFVVCSNMADCSIKHTYKHLRFSFLIPHT